MAGRFAAPLALLLAGCSLVDASGADPRLVILDEDSAQLEAAFNDGEDARRMIVVLAPT